jgi:RNA polymerase sigma-70 factor (ECF subfamily)
VLAARARRELQSPKAFLFATARNLACDQFRRAPGAAQVPLGDGDDFSVLDETTDIFETVARNQEIELMTEAIQSLPDRCRQVLTLRNVYGLSQREIAAQMGIAVATVEVQITAGIKRCTEFVARRTRRNRP